MFLFTHEHYLGILSIRRFLFHSRAFGFLLQFVLFPFSGSLRIYPFGTANHCLEIRTAWTAHRGVFPRKSNSTGSHNSATGRDGRWRHIGPDDAARLGRCSNDSWWLYAATWYAAFRHSVLLDSILAWGRVIFMASTPRGMQYRAPRLKNNASRQAFWLIRHTSSWLNLSRPLLLLANTSHGLLAYAMQALGALRYSFEERFYERS